MARHKLLLRLVALCAVAAQAQMDPLSKWLYDLKIPIPPIAAAYEGFLFNLTDGVCTHLVVGALSAGGGAAPARVAVTASDVGVACTLDWRYAEESFPHLSGSGTVAATVSKSRASAALTVGADGSPRAFPDRAALESCDADVVVSDLDFSGGVSAWILKLLSGFVERELSAKLGDELCDAVGPLVETNLTALLREATTRTKACASAADAASSASRAAAAAAVTPATVDWAGSRAAEFGGKTAARLAECAFRETWNFAPNATASVDVAGARVTLSLAELNVTGLAATTVALAPAANASWDLRSSTPARVNATGRLAVTVETPLAAAPLREDFLARVALADAAVAAVVQVAADPEPLLSATLGALDAAPGPCAARAAVRVAATDLSFGAAGYDDVSLAPAAPAAAPLEAGLDEVLDVAAAALFGGFPGFVDGLLRCGLDGVGRDAANAAVDDALRAWRKEPCAGETHARDGALVQWQDSALLRDLDAVVDADAANFAARCFAGSASDFGVTVEAAGFDTFTALTVLAGDGRDGGAHVASHATLDGPATVTVAYDPGLRKTKFPAIPKMNATVTTAGVAGGLGLRLPLVRAALLDNATLRDVLSKGCGLAEAWRGAPAVDALSLAAESATAAVRGLGPVDDAAAANALAALAVELELVWRDYALAAVNDALARSAAAAAAACAATGGKNDEKHWTAAERALLGVACAFIFAACVAFLFGRARRRRARVRDELAEPLVERSARLEIAAPAAAPDAPLGFDGEVPLALRVLVPPLLALTCGAFLWSNLTYAASVNVELELFKNAGLEHGAVRVDLGSMFQFSLANSVKDMWKAGVYPLSMLIALCSGGWPYLKLALAGTCWLAPPSRLPVERRETLLIWLDALGKWSLIDTYVMTLMMVAFHFDISLGDVTGDARAAALVDAVVIHVYIEALPSFFVFVGASCASLVLGHVAIASHRRVANRRQTRALAAAAPRAAAAPEKVAALCDHAFDEPIPHLGGRRALPRLATRGVAAMLVGTLLLLVAGATLDSFDFEIKGAAGWVLGPDDARRHYSLVALGEAVPAASKDPNGPGARALASVYFAYGFALPLLQLPMLLMLWLLPLSLGHARRLYVACEVVNAWAALDVFVLAVVVALVEISQFAAFMVGDRCDLINKLLAKVLDKQLDGDDVCFDVVTELNRGAWLLVPAAVVSGVVAQYLLRFAHKALAQRSRRAHDRALAEGGVSVSI